MHQHDADLIMALAAGELDADSATRAEAAIASCADCRRDLEMQRVAIAAAAQVPAVFLTARESAHLHATLAREFGSPAPRPATNSAWVRRLAYAFGTAAVLVGVVFAGVGLLNGGSDNDSAADVAALRSSAEAATAPSPATDGAGLADTGDLTAGDSSGGASNDTSVVQFQAEDMEPSATTTAGAATTTVAASSAPALRIFTDEPPPRIKATVLDDLAEPTSDFYAADKNARLSSAGLTSCLAGLQDEVAENATADYVGGVLVAPDGSRQYIVAFVTDDVATATVAAITVDPCAVAAVYP